MGKASGWFLDMKCQTCFPLVSAISCDNRVIASRSGQGARPDSQPHSLIMCGILCHTYITVLL